MVNEDIVNYVKSNLDKKYPIHEIIGALKGGGWSTDDIMEIFQVLRIEYDRGAVEAASKIVPRKGSKKSKDTAIVILVIVLVILVAMSLSYFLFFKS